MVKEIKPETEYFAKIDIEKKRDIIVKKHSEMLQEELDKLKKFHWMHCANCGWNLEEFIFKGLTIHKCLHCGGSFLMEGELEKLCGEESTFLDNVIDLFKF